MLANQGERKRLARLWSGPCGMRELLGLAVPLIISTLSMAVMQFCDRVFLTWHSTTAVAAVIQAGAIGWVLYSFPLGLTMYTTAFVAQYAGAGQGANIGRIVWQAIYLGAATIPLFLLAGWWLPGTFDAFGHSSALQVAETTYLRILCWSLGTQIVAEALTAYFAGIGRTAVLMFVNVGAAAANVGLDGLLIFGWGPIPELGIAGAAWATNIALWLKFAALAILFFGSVDRLRHGLLSGWRLSLPLTGRLLRFGSPQGLHFLLEGVAVTVFIVLMGGISDQASAATAIALSANMVVFVPVIGLGIALTTLVGREVGHRRIALAERATRMALGVGVAYSLLLAALYLFAPILFVGMHARAAPDVPAEVELARFLLRFVAAYCLFDTLQLVYQSAIKAAGDTWFVLQITVLMSALFVLAGVVGGAWTPYEAGQVQWWWWMLTAWIFSLSLIYAWRYRGGKWKTMSVIERPPEPAPPACAVPATEPAAGGR